MNRETHNLISYNMAVEFTFLVTEMFAVRHLFLPLLDSGPYHCVIDPPLRAVDTSPFQSSNTRPCFYFYGGFQDVHSLQNRCIFLVTNYTVLRGSLTETTEAESYRFFDAEICKFEFIILAMRISDSFNYRHQSCRL